MVLRKGLNGGERVITEGIQRNRPGQVVIATEANPGRSHDPDAFGHSLDPGER